MGGYLMQTQHFSVNDGEGIRTTLFLAGCPLRCAWCANPEGQTCQNPMTRWAETEEVLRALEGQRIFYRFSGGGVTFSGGEATMQGDFLKELTDALYDDGCSLALETCGVFDFDPLAPTLAKMDQIFYDLKHLDPEVHRKFTGMDNKLILENLPRVAALGPDLVVRVPVVKGFNGDDASLEAIFRWLADRVPGGKIELLPYHRFGEEKYRQLGRPLPPASFTVPSPGELDRWRARAADHGLTVVSYR